MTRDGAYAILAMLLLFATCLALGRVDCRASLRVAIADNLIFAGCQRP